MPAEIKRVVQSIKLDAAKAVEDVQGFTSLSSQCACYITVEPWIHVHYRGP